MRSLHHHPGLDKPSEADSRRSGAMRGGAGSPNSAHRKKRPQPMVGVMLQKDAWRSVRPPGNERQYDLVVTRDRPISTVPSRLIVEKGRGSNFRALAKVIDHQGLYCGLDCGHAAAPNRRYEAPWR